MKPKYPNDHTDSIIQLSDEEFEALDRKNGRIVNFASCYHVLTAGQIERIDPDDHAYYEDLLEEERSLLAQIYDMEC